MFLTSFGYIAELAAEAAIRAPDIMGQIAAWVRMALCGVLLRAATLLSLMVVGLRFAAYPTLKPSGATDRKTSLDKKNSEDWVYGLPESAARLITSSSES